MDGVQSRDRKPVFKPRLCNNLCCKFPQLGPLFPLYTPNRLTRWHPGPFQLQNPTVTC